MIWSLDYQISKHISNYVVQSSVTTRTVVEMFLFRIKVVQNIKSRTRLNVYLLSFERWTQDEETFRKVSCSLLLMFLNEFLCLFHPSFIFFFVFNLTNDRVANPFSLYLETPSISKMHKHWKVWVVNSTSTVSLSDPVERSAFLMILLFAFIEEGLHFAGFLFLRIFFISAVFFRVTSSGYLLNYQVDNDLFVYMRINASLMWQVMLSSSSLNSSQCTENSS